MSGNLAPYLVPVASNRDELMIEHSRFIGTLMNVLSVDTVKSAVNAVRGEFPDANHHVYAYRIGHGNSVIEGLSDAGEPPGTAGPPVMAVLRGSNVGDVLVVVTRYFGGRKLGTGGLVRAYTDTARLVIQNAVLELKIAKVIVTIDISYSLYTITKRVILQTDGIILEENFGATIMMMIQMPQSQYPRLVTTISDLSSGSVVPILIESSD